MLNANANAWLKSRGIDPAVAEAHNIRSVERTGGDWLAFPVERDGKVITTKYRRIDEKGFSQDAGAPFKLCWNEDSLSMGSGPVIITEGEMDGLALLQAGCERVISVPDGAPARAVEDDGSDKWSYLDALLTRLKGERHIVLATDGDAPGAHLRDYLAKRLGKARCRYLRYPAGCKDSNDVLRKHSAQELLRIVEEAPYIAVPGLTKLKDMPPPKEQKIYKASVGGPNVDFDKHISLLRGHMSLWTGIPGHGKSTLVLATCLEMMRRHQWKFGCAVFEDDVQLDFRRNVATYIANKPVDELTDEEWDLADQRLDEHFCFIVETEDLGVRMTVDWLIEQMEAAVMRYGADMIVIDPWSKLDHSRPGGVSENDYTGQVLNTIKRFARAFDVHVAIVAHPKKMEEAGNGSFKIPNGYSISGSAHWYNMVDLGITSYRETRDNGDSVARAVVWKVKRQATMGPTGSFVMQLNNKTGRYSDYYDQETADA